MLTKVTSRDFQGLTNPYTGEEMVVFMRTGGNKVLFTCPDTFSTNATVSDSRELYNLWNRVNGVQGLRTGKPIVCAYTGEPLRIAEQLTGKCYVGGFDPRRYYTREQFLYYAWMRDGKSKYPKPDEKKQSRVKALRPEGEVTQAQRDHAESFTPSLDEEKVHMVEASMKKFKDTIEGSSTVSMAVTNKRGSRGK